MQKATRSRYFLPKSILIATLGLVTCLGSYKAAAIDPVVTDPVGFITLTAQGTSGASGQSFWGLGMTQIPTNIGLVGDVSGNLVTLSNQTLVANQFASVAAGPQYFIEITSGGNDHAGLQDDITNNTTTAVFTANNDSSKIAAGQTYKIYPHWTIAKVFGPADESGLKQGSSAAAADSIKVLNPLTQGFATYYYSTSSKFITAGWKQDGVANTDKSAVPLYIDQGFYIVKQTTTNNIIKLVGAVKLGKTIVPLAPLNNLAANVYASSNMTLGTSGLYTDGNQTDSFVAGSSAAVADVIKIHDDITGGFATYYFSTSSKFITAGWKQDGVANTDKSAVQIPIGANALVQIRSPRPGFNWQPAAPYTP